MQLQRNQSWQLLAVFIKSCHVVTRRNVAQSLPLMRRSLANFIQNVNTTFSRDWSFTIPPRVLHHPSGTPSSDCCFFLWSKKPRSRILTIYADRLLYGNSFAWWKILRMTQQYFFINIRCKCRCVSCMFWNYYKIYSLIPILIIIIHRKINIERFINPYKTNCKSVFKEIAVASRTFHKLKPFRK